MDNLIAQRLQNFKKEKGIKSDQLWADTCGVSKSTVVRALKGDCKDMGVVTLTKMVVPYGGTVDEILGIGSYSPEAQFKSEIVEKIDEVIEVIENAEEIPAAPTQEIKEVLTAAQEIITNEPAENTKCVGCGTLREMISRMDKEIESKNTWLTKLFGLSFVFLIILFVSLVINGVLSLCIINMLK